MAFNHRSPTRLPALGENESLIRTCTGQMLLVDGKIQKEQVIPAPLGIGRCMAELGGKESCTWKASSSRVDFGVENLRDSLKYTAWKSDGGAPQSLTITFNKKTVVSFVYFYVCYQIDAGQCPKTVLVRAGDGPGELNDVIEVTLERKMEGWVKIPVKANDWQPVSCKVLELVIKENITNASCVTIREVNVYGLKPRLSDVGRRSLDGRDPQQLERMEFPR